MALDHNNILLRFLNSRYCKAVPVFVESSITFFNKISLNSKAPLYFERWASSSCAAEKLQSFHSSTFFQKYNK